MSSKIQQHKSKTLKLSLNLERLKQDGLNAFICLGEKIKNWREEESQMDGRYTGGRKDNPRSSCGEMRFSPSGKDLKKRTPVKQQSLRTDLLLW